MDVMGVLVVFASEDGADGPAGWKPLRPEEVPEWIRAQPDVLGRMVAGETVQSSASGDARWFRAQRAVDTSVRAANDDDAGDTVLAIRSPVVMKPHQPIVLLPGKVDL